MPKPPRSPSSPLRLILVSHALTEAQRQARFPLDEPIIGTAVIGTANINTAGGSLTNAITSRVDECLAGPEQRTLQTANALGLNCKPEQALADIDHGSWAGQTMADLSESDLLSWLTDPSSIPHGGESVTALIDRVGQWLAGLSQPGERIVAVTHPAVIRAAIVCALGAPAAAFWRIDVAPATKTVLHGRGQRWTLRTTAAPLVGDVGATAS